MVVLNFAKIRNRVCYLEGGCFFIYLLWLMYVHTKTGGIY